MGDEYVGEGQVKVDLKGQVEIEWCIRSSLKVKLLRKLDVNLSKHTTSDS